MKKYFSPEAALALILIISAIVRFVFFRQLAATDLVTVPLLDSLAYHEWAARLVAGDPGWGEAYWMGPLYPHLLALVYGVFGVGTMAISGLQLVLSLVNIWLVFLLTRNFLWEDDSPSPAWAAVLSAGLYAMYGAPVFYAGMILMATLVTTLYLLVARQTLLAWRSNTTASWLVLGLLVGLTGLARGNIFLLLVLLPLLILKKNTGPDRWKKSAALVIAGLLMLVPTTVRNLLVADDFVILTTNGGINLLIGQQADYGGIFAPMVPEGQTDYDASMEKSLELEMERDLKGSEVSRILTGRAWDEFRLNLGAMPGHYLRKAYRFWNGYELPQIFSYNFWHGQFSALRILVVPFFLLTALGLLGIRFLPRGPQLIMVLLLAGYFLSLLPFFPTSRYRMPVAPLLAISAGVFLMAWWHMNRPLKVRWLVCSVLLVTAILPRWAALDQAEILWQVHLHEASRASKQGDLKKTLSKVRLAEEANPGLAETPYRLAVFLEEVEAWPQAEAALQLAATRAPRNSKIPYRMGVFQDRQGKWPDALNSFRRAANMDPQWAFPWLRAGMTLRKAGQMDDAIDAFEKAYALSPGNHRIRSNLASAYASVEQYDAARELLGQLVEDFPNYVNGWFNLALVQWRSGREDDARVALKMAGEIRNLTPGQVRRVGSLEEMMGQ